MKAYKGSKLLASDVRDCKGFMSALGLRFRRDFGRHDAYLIHMLFDSVLDSFFVRFDFLAAWLDKNNKVIEVIECTKNKLFSPIAGQRLVLELPISMKNAVKKGDTVRFKP